MRAPGFCGYKKAPVHDTLQSKVVLEDLPSANTQENNKRAQHPKTHMSWTVWILENHAFWCFGVVAEKCHLPLFSYQNGRTDTCV